MLKTLLQQNKCFKLVLGAGNENLEQIEKLVTIYAQAGCRFFDISADLEVLKTAKNTITKIGFNIEDFAFCISIGIKDDPHIQKAIINKKSCINCLKCISTCPQNAINNNLEIIEQNCIGCQKCFKICPSNAISFYDKQKDLCKVLPDLINEGIDCIELHANSLNEEEFEEKWKYLNKIFDGFLSLCLDRSNLSSKSFIQRIQKALKHRKPYTTIIQADGNPMSGSDNSYQTTLEAIATAKLVQDENLPAFLLLSGGTNAKTAELAKLCNIKANGISVGSYARKLVQKYINNNDFDKAIAEAKKLIQTFN